MRVTLLSWTAAAAACASCSAPHSTPDRFGGTGELVALSGAGAGSENACFTCHGLDGGGDGAGVPRLAGLDSGYLQHQMVAFADGRRDNPSMRWIAKQLDPREIQLVSAHYAGMRPPRAQGPGTPAPPEIFIAGDPKRGIPPCASCHGVDGTGIGQAIPPLAGQPGAYLAQQLESWRRGRRRSDPDGVMLEIARALTPAEVEAVSAYASRLPPGTPHPEPREASPPGRRPDPRNDASVLPRRVAGS